MSQSLQAAREQIAETLGFLATTTFEVGDERFTVRSINLLSDDEQEQYDQLQIDLEGYDHEDVIVRSPITGEVIVNPKTEEPLTEKVLKVPHRIKGERVSPSHNVKLARLLLGDDEYARFKAAGGSANDIAMEIARQNRKMMERQKADSKSK